MSAETDIFDMCCPECGWHGDWDQVVLVKRDGYKVPSCPECGGLEVQEINCEKDET